MNPKQLKYHSLFEQMAQSDPMTEASAKKFLPQFMTLDFQLALDVWDYLCTTREELLMKDKNAGLLLGDNALDLFYRKSAPKPVKCLFETPAVRRAVFQYSPTANDGIAFNALVDVLVANKTAYAEEAFKCLVKNERIAYGPFMKALLERVFIEILKKSTSKKLEMNRKLAALLLTYIGKIKTDERAMLEQRIRETM